MNTTLTKNNRMTPLTDNIWAVEVPDDAEDIRLSDETQDHDNAKQFILFYLKEGNLQPLETLPPGSWQYLFTIKDATAEDARKVVRELAVGQRYENYNGDYPVWYHTECESLQSLLLSKGCDRNKNYAIILKVNDNG